MELINRHNPCGDSFKNQGYNVHDCTYRESKEFTPILPIVEDDDGMYWGTDGIQLRSLWVAYCPYCGEKLGKWK